MAACLASPRRAPGNLGRPSQALSALGAKARAGRSSWRPVPARPRGLSRLPWSRGAAVARGKGRPARGTHLLVLVGTHRAGRGTPPGRASATTRKREPRPRTRGVPLPSPGLREAHPWHRRQESRAPPAFRQLEAARGGCVGGEPEAAEGGALGQPGRRCGAAPQRLRLLLLPAPLLALSLPTPISYPRRRRASSYVLWSGVKFRDSGWCRSLSLRCRKCFLCRCGRVPGSLAGGHGLRGGSGGDGPWRFAGYPACFPSSSPGLRRPATAAAGPGRAAWVSPAPKTRGGGRDRRDNAGLGRPCVFLWRLRGPSWHFSSSH